MKKPIRKADSASRPKAKPTQATGYGTNNKRRAKPEDNDFPKAKRPQASGYGTNSTRRTKQEDETTPRRRPKAVFDSGERPAPRRRISDSEERPRRKSTGTGDSTTPRRGANATFRDQNQGSFAKPRRSRTTESDREERPKARNRYGSENKSWGEKPRNARPTNRFGNDYKQRREEQDNGYPARRSNIGSGNDYKRKEEQDSRPARRSNVRFENDYKQRKEEQDSSRPTRRTNVRFENDYKQRREEQDNSRPVRRSNVRFENEEGRRPRRGSEVPAKSENNRRFASKGNGDLKKNFRSKPVRTPDYDFTEIESKRKKNREENGDAVRLNRYIANAGVCSRRDADVLIQSGEIKVNSKVVTEMGYQVKPGDIVKYGNRVLNREKMAYVLLNKPKDFITTTEDPEERRTVMDLVKEASGGRLFPVGRLDRNTTGLLLLTNDGELSEKLTHPSHNVSKIYEVHLDKPVNEEDFDRILKGVELEDGVAPVDDLAVVTPDRTVLGMELHLGRNRIVRRIFEHLGYEVLKLDRVMYAGLTKKDLSRGKWRYLSEKEVIRLKYFI